MRRRQVLEILTATYDVKTAKCELCIPVVVQISVVVGTVTGACVESSSMVCEALKLVNGRSVYYLLTLLPSHGWYGSSEEVGHASQYVIMLNTHHVFPLEKYY